MKLKHKNQLQKAIETKSKVTSIEEVWTDVFHVKHTTVSSRYICFVQDEAAGYLDGAEFFIHAQHIRQARAWRCQKVCHAVYMAILCQKETIFFRLDTINFRENKMVYEPENGCFNYILTVGKDGVIVEKKKGVKK